MNLFIHYGNCVDAVLYVAKRREIIYGCLVLAVAYYIENDRRCEAPFAYFM